MGVLLEGIKRYFETTPKDILDKEWEEKEYLDKIGPDVMEYVDYVRKNFGIDIMNKKNNINREYETKRKNTTK